MERRRKRRRRSGTHESLHAQSASSPKLARTSKASTQPVQLARTVPLVHWAQGKVEMQSEFDARLELVEGQKKKLEKTLRLERAKHNRGRKAWARQQRRAEKKEEQLSLSIEQLTREKVALELQVTQFRTALATHREKWQALSNTATTLQQHLDQAAPGRTKEGGDGGGNKKKTALDKLAASMSKLVASAQSSVTALQELKEALDERKSLDHEKVAELTGQLEKVIHQD